MSALSVGPRRGHPAGLPEEPLWRQDAGEPLQAPTPAQVVGQVLGRNPVAAVPPSCQSAIVSVDVLDVEGVVHHPNPGTEVNGPMGDVKLLGQGDLDGAAVGAQYHIGVQDRLQDGAYLLGIGQQFQIWPYRSNSVPVRASNRGRRTGFSVRKAPWIWSLEIRAVARAAA